MFDILVVDLMHEVELGVWKAIFIHLLRILDSQDEGLKHELDRRYVTNQLYCYDNLMNASDSEKYLLSALMEYVEYYQTPRSLSERPPMILKICYR